MRTYAALTLATLLLAALVFSGVAAAIMSTVNSFMSIGAAALTHDLPVALGRRVGNELRWGRISTVVISVVAALVAQASGTLVAFLGIFCSPRRWCPRWRSVSTGKVPPALAR